MRSREQNRSMMMLDMRFLNADRESSSTLLSSNYSESYRSAY